MNSSDSSNRSGTVQNSKRGMELNKLCLLNSSDDICPLFYKNNSAMPLSRVYYAPTHLKDVKLIFVEKHWYFMFNHLNNYI